MTVEELQFLSELIEEKSSGDYYLFWHYGGKPLVHALIIKYKPMPCTPMGDLVANVTDMTYDDACEVVRDKVPIRHKTLLQIGFRVSEDVLESLK